MALVFLAQQDHGPSAPPQIGHLEETRHAPALANLKGPISLINGTVTVEIEVGGRMTSVPVTFRGQRGHHLTELQVASRRFVVHDRLAPGDAKTAVEHIRDVLWNGRVELTSDMGSVTVTMQELQRIIRSLHQNPSGNCVESVEFSFTGLASVYGGGTVSITFVEVQPSERFAESVARNQ